MNEKILALINKLKPFFWILLFFFFFLVQHTFEAGTMDSDREAYLFQGKWFCGEQVYFEWLRPPLPGIVNCLFGAGNESPIFSAVFFSFLYLGAILLMYKKERKQAKINQLTFATFAFLFPLVFFSPDFGSDVLALSLLTLSFYVRTPTKKGLLIGLASLARYNYFIFIIAHLFDLKKKDLPRFFSLIALTLAPWAVYNFVNTGDPFFSIKEQILINVQLKGIWPLSLIQILLILFFALTLFLDRKNNLTKGINKAGIITAIIFLVSGSKHNRYLLTLAPGQALNIAKTVYNNPKIKIVIGLLAVALLLSAPLANQPKDPEVEIPETIKNCLVYSDVWNIFYNQGIIAKPLPSWPSKMNLENPLQNGAVLLIYHKDVFDLEKLRGKYEIIETPQYTIVKPSKCEPPPKKYELKIKELAEELDYDLSQKMNKNL